MADRRTFSLSTRVTLAAVAVLVACAGAGLTLVASTGASRLWPSPDADAGQGVRTVRDDSAVLTAMLHAEDRRPTTRAGAAPLLRGLESDAPGVQDAALLGLGRLENPEFIPDIVPLLESPVPAVRAQAANALGQAVTNGDARLAAEPLRARARVEQDFAVRGMLARTLGRLPYRTAAEVREAEEAMLALSWKPDAGAGASAGASATGSRAREDSPIETLFGVAHGFYSLARKSGRLMAPPAAASGAASAVASQSPATSAAPSAGAAFPLFSAETLSRLRQFARHGVKADSSEAALTDGLREDNRRVRRLALLALTSAKDVDVPLLEGAISDPDDQVRRLTLLASMANGPTPVAARLVERVLHDPSFNVRFEALRVHGRLRAAAGSASTASGPSSSCQPELDALADANTHVVLLAIDLLGDCAGQPGVADHLTALADARAKVRAGEDWHRTAHAIASLARVAPDRAASRLTRLAQDEVWEVRAYVAKAAGALKDRAQLEALAQDANDNVRNAAVDALRPFAGHDADRVYLAQLPRPDYQLVRTAALALAAPAASTATGSSRAAASATAPTAAVATASAAGRDSATVPPSASQSGGGASSPTPAEIAEAAFAALARTTADRKDTSRDPRVALIDLLAVSAAQVETAPARLERYLTDFDPAVGERAAKVLTTWTGRPAEAQPHRLIPVAPPTWRAVHAESERGITAIVHMARGRTFTITLFPLNAPTNVMRFIRQVRARELDGLTFHRVEPNFVIQGGSPHANEYTGDARFTRDEVSARPQVRGTVGISTRGHDTGDGQIYVNLADNYRLDHAYTLIGAVTDGMDTVEAVLEGEVIDHIELRPTTATASGSTAVPR